jgi:hypothetical protein
MRLARMDDYERHLNRVHSISAKAPRAAAMI